MLLIFLSLFYLHAEYRVYQLNIVSEEGAQVREVLSTIDHLQYSTYFHVKQNEEVVYIDSWKCFGHTGNFKTYCPNPKNSAGRLPSSLMEN